MLPGNDMEKNSTNTTFTLDLWTESALVSNILNVALGVPLNLSVLGLIASGRLVKGSEITALNQTLCELALCMSSLANILQYYIPNQHLDSALNFFMGLQTVGRLLFMTKVCLRVYLAVSHPVAFLRLKPRRTQVAVSVACWLVVLGYCISTSLVGKKKQALVALVLTTGSILVQLTFGVLILRRLVQPGPGDQKEGTAGLCGVKLRAFVIIATLLVSTLFTFLPVCVMTGMSQVLSYREFVDSSSIALYVAVFGGFINPLLWVCRAESLPCIRAP